MHWRDAIICSVCVSLAAFLLITAGIWLDYINLQREQMDLIVERAENIPPTLAFATVATGAFRGLVVDVLWMRADKLKEQGQFFDAKQLAEWITTLQPRFPSVWEFQAWNMAYNISVAIPPTQPDQRWLWVRNGYELLRDKGIRWNPKSLELYRELARIFQHKIGGVTDDAHKYYKIQLALAMEPLLGAANNEYFEALAKAPTEWQLIKSDANEFITELASTDEAFSAEGAGFVSNYLLLRQNAGRFNPASGITIDNFRGTKTLKKFDIFAKAYELRNTWKLDPVLMQEINKTYGPVDFDDPNTHLPLDWRHPDSHAIYWAVKGLQQAGTSELPEVRKIDVPETNTDRIVAQSLQNLFRNGKIFIFDVPVQIPQDSASPPAYTSIKDIFLRPDLRMFEPYNDAVLAILDKYKKTADIQRLVSFGNGHRNMLKNAVFSFYQSGHRDQAQKIYNQLRKLYPREEFKSPVVDEYVKMRFRDELKNLTIDDAKEQIMSILRESYYLYAIRDDDAAFGREKIAEEIHQYYLSEYKNESRIDLPEFPLLRYFALMDFIYDQRYPSYLRQSLLGRIKVERPELAEQLEQQEKKLIEQQKQTQ
jgi:hypothetical protein